jgi:hypothetical protein
VISEQPSRVPDRLCGRTRDIIVNASWIPIGQFCCDRGCQSASSTHQLFDAWPAGAAAGEGEAAHEHVGLKGALADMETF